MLLFGEKKLFSTDDERLYGFIRIESGDELSKRAKFVLVAWVGENLSAMKKAKVGTDKSSVKAVLKVNKRFAFTDFFQHFEI